MMFFIIYIQFLCIIIEFITRLANYYSYYMNIFKAVNKSDDCELLQSDLDRLCVVLILQ